MVERCCNVVVNKNESTILCAVLLIQVAESHGNKGHSTPASSIAVTKEITPKVQSQLSFTPCIT